MIPFNELPDDKPMSLPIAARSLGSITGQTPQVSTLWRWCLWGCKGVKPESICIGGKRFVTRAAIERFIENSTANQTPSATTVVTVAPRTPPQVVRHNQRRRAEIDAARGRLDELTGVTRPASDSHQDVSRSA